MVAEAGELLEEASLLVLAGLRLNTDRHPSQSIYELGRFAGCCLHGLGQ